MFSYPRDVNRPSPTAKVDDARDSSPMSARKRKNEEDAGLILDRWRSKRIKLELPPITELARIVDLPLSDEDKIPISLEHMETLVSSVELQDICTMADIQLLFRPGDHFHPLQKFSFTITDAPPTMGTEESFIHFWDNNVRSILELIVPDGNSIRRDSDQEESSIPDYAFLVRNLCIFQGIEKAPDNDDDPKKEFADKLIWTYQPAPYILGYYAIGPDFTLVAISPPSHEQGCPVHCIAHANLRRRADRIKNICRLINLAGLFQQLADIVRPSVAEFDALERDNGIAGPCIGKAYNSSDEVDHLQN